MINSTELYIFGFGVCWGIILLGFIEKTSDWISMLSGGIILSFISIFYIIYYRKKSSEEKEK